MKPSKWLLFVALASLVLFHNATWFSNAAKLILGIPVGLFYHAVLCVVTSLLLAILVYVAWPDHLEVEQNGDQKAQ